VALLGQTPLLLLVSLSLDSVVWLGRRNGWKGAKQYAWELVAALVSTMLVAGFILVALHLAVHPGDTLNGTLALDLALALLLVLPTGLLSGRAASTLSKSLQILRR
jgi:hypothetical protein